MRRIRSSAVRDLQLGASRGKGDWITPNTVIVDNNLAGSASSWPGTTLGLIAPSSMRTIQLVRIFPNQVGTTPLVGRVRIDEIDCTFHYYVDTQECFDGSLVTPAIPGSTFVALTTVPSVSTTVGATSGNITGTTTAITPWTATTSVNPASNLSSPIGLAATDIAVPSVTIPFSGCFEERKSFCIGVALYVAQINASTNIWDVHDPLLEATANREDILDLQTDMFLRPVLAFGATGRSWRLSLPYPIEIGQGQALHATFSCAAFNSGYVELTTFARSLITQIS